MRRKIREQQAKYVQETYADELRKTKTVAAMADVVEYEGAGKYIFEVCTTDKSGECESGDQLVVPNIAEAQAAEEDGKAEFFSDDDIRYNGLSVEDNCRVIAEHELVHFWYQYLAAAHTGGLGSANPADWAAINVGDNVVISLKSLLVDIDTERDYDGTYSNEYDYLEERTNYALNPGPRGSTAAETPAVLHEMSSFLDKRLLVITGETEPDDDPAERLREIQRKITVIADKFPRGELAAV